VNEDPTGPFVVRMAAIGSVTDDRAVRVARRDRVRPLGVLRCERVVVGSSGTLSTLAGHYAAMAS
jgi:hypothetical protein